MYLSGKLNIPDHASSRFNLQYFTLWASVDKVDNGTVDTYIYCGNELCDSETVSGKTIRQVWEGNNLLQEKTEQRRDAGIK